MNYRVAKLEDAVNIDNLLTKLIKDEKENYDNSLENIIVRDYYKNIIGKDNNQIFICESDNIIGYIYVYIKGKKAIIDALYVEEKFRNKKIATNLINLAVKWLKKSEIENIEISVMHDNKIAKKVYEKLGFNSFKETLRLNIK